MIEHEKLLPVLVLASGGIDSTCCLQYYKRTSRFLVKALFVDYGQAAFKEEYAAVRRVTEELDISLKTVEVKHDQTFGVGEIPGRNAFLLLTGLLTNPFSSGLISIGIHGGTAYPDCSPGFIKRMQHVLDLYNDGKYVIDAPFATLSKKNIFELAHDFEIPINLTYSCESGGTAMCGLCESCKDRLELNA
jgi:7-cyano-7-deazaguanine synthase